MAVISEDDVKVQHATSVVCMAFGRTFCIEGPTTQSAVPKLGLRLWSAYSMVSSVGRAL